MEDNMLNILDTVDVLISLLRERDKQIRIEQDMYLSTQRKIANLYMLNEKLLKERNALRRKLTLIEIDEKC